MPRFPIYVKDDDRHLVEELEERARREDRNRSSQVVRYIREGLERDDEEDRDRARRNRR